MIKKIISSPITAVLISGLLLVYIFSKIDLQETLEVLKSADIFYISVSAGIFLFIYGFLLVRWFWFIKAVGLKVKRINVVRNFFIGLFGNLFMPSAIGGDVLKTLGLCQGHAQKAKVVASVILDRVSGFVSIVIVCCAAFVFGFRYINDASLIIPVVLMGMGCFCILLVLLNKRFYEFFCRVFNCFPKIKDVLMKLHYDIALMKENPIEGVKAVLISCVSQLTLAVSYYYLAKALHQDIDLIYFLIFSPLICIAAVVPSIGGLGVRETGSIYLFAKIGVSAEIAASLTLINFMFIIVVGLIGGLVYVFTVSSGRVQHYSQNAVGS